MPNRQIVGGEPYRYGYQGEFAETDPETGKPAFQLRLYDPRINRWISPDPYGQYHSPYIGMGNDWTNGIDPDGGYKTKWGRFWAWVGSGFKGSFTSSNNPGTPWHKYGIKRETEDGLSFDFGLTGGGHKELIDYGYQVNDVNYYNRGYGFIRAAKYDWTDKWSESNNFFSKLSYGFVNDFYVTGQTLNPFDTQLTNFDGSGVARGSNEHLDNGINVLTTFIPASRGTKGLAPLKKLNASQFSQTFKGNLSRLKPSTRGVMNVLINKQVVKINKNIHTGSVLFDGIDFVDYLNQE